MSNTTIQRLLRPADEPTDELALSYALAAPDPDDVASAVEAEDLPSIMRDAGGDRERELELVNDQLRIIAWVDRRAEDFLGVARRELDRLEAYIERTETARDRVTAYLGRRIEDWRRERGDPAKGRRTYDLPNGSVGMRRTRGKTKIVDAAVIAYVLEQPDEELMNTVLERKWTVKAKALRERFEIASNGAVVDKRTGMVIEPQAYYNEDGEVLTAPLLVQTEPPGDKLVLEVRGTKTLKEAETDAQ